MTHSHPSPHSLTPESAVRLPVLIFFGCAAAWLSVGTFLGAFAGIKLICPTFLDGIGFLSFGRVVPAAINALVYGWASSAALGIALWLLARLGKASPRPPIMPVAAALFWNFGVFIGVIAILAGYSRSIFLLEFPGFVSAILFGAYLFVAIWAIQIFHQRQPGSIFVSAWYLVAALLWFPWLYFTANALLIWSPVSGAAQSPIAAWFAGGMINLWLTPIALATAFYLVPQILGRRLASYSLCVLGFWSYAIFAGWAGLSLRIGGPVPAWMVSAGVVASVFLIISVIVTTMSFWGTVQGSLEAMEWSPSLRFALTGVGAFVIAYSLGACLALPFINVNFFFSDVFSSQGILLLLGFVSMCFFGAIYYIVPRLLGRAWCCDSFIRFHYWFFLIGGSLAWMCLLFGGMLQGYGLNDPEVRFESTVGYATPFRLVAVLGLITLFVGSKIFGALLFRTILLTLEEPKPSTRAVTV